MVHITNTLPSDAGIGTLENASHRSPTPYAVICRTHGKQYLSNTQYHQRMMATNSLWTCPICDRTAEWDDDNYDSYHEEQS